MPSFPVQQKTLSANYFHTSSQCLKKKKRKVWKQVVSKKPFILTNWDSDTITPSVNPTKFPTMLVL